MHNNSNLERVAELVHWNMSWKWYIRFDTACNGNAGPGHTLRPKRMLDGQKRRIQKDGPHASRWYASAEWLVVEVQNCLTNTAESKLRNMAASIALDIFAYTSGLNGSKSARQGVSMASYIQNPCLAIAVPFVLRHQFGVVAQRQSICILDCRQSG